MKPIKHIERGLAGAAGWLFNSIQLVNRYKPNPSFTPKWVGQAIAEVLAEDEADPWLAEDH